MVENDTSSVEYQLSTSTGPFSIPFYFIENGHIVAELYTQNGDDFNKTTLTIDVDYYLNGAGDKNGGQLTLLSAHSGATLLIYRDPDATQLTSYLATGKFPATSHERALDKLTMLIQKFGWWWDSLALKKPNIFANYYDALNNRIRNLRDPSLAQDAATKSYVDSRDIDLQQQITSNFNRSLRVPDSYISQLPSAQDRAWKGLGFDGAGQPKLQDPAGTGLWGYVPAIGSFEQGSLLTQRFEVLLWESTDEYWRWDGVMPKVVLPGSTPATAGGTGKGKWIDVTDATLRSNLGSSEPGMGAGISKLEQPGNVQNALREFYADAFPGVDPTGQTSSTQGILDAIAKINSQVDSTFNGDITTYPRLVFRGGVFLAAGLLVKSNIVIEGNDGTLFVPEAGTDASHVWITEGTEATTPSGGAKRLFRPVFRNIKIGYGFQNKFPGVVIAENVGGIKLEHSSYAIIENVEMRYLDGEGLTGESVWDSTIYNVRIMHCGNTRDRNNIKYGLNFGPGNDGTDGSNANRFIGLHIETCPAMMKIGLRSRHNFIIGGKLEGIRNNDPLAYGPSVFEGVDGLQFIGVELSWSNIGHRMFRAVGTTVMNDTSDDDTSDYDNDHCRGIEFIGCHTIDSQNLSGDYFEYSSKRGRLNITGGYMHHVRYLLTGSDINLRGVTLTQCGPTLGNIVDNVLVEGLTVENHRVLPSGTFNVFSVSGKNNIIRNSHFSTPYGSNSNGCAWIAQSSVADLRVENVTFGGKMQWGIKGAPSAFQYKKFKNLVLADGADYGEIVQGGFSVDGFPTQMNKNSGGAVTDQKDIANDATGVISGCIKGGCLISISVESSSSVFIGATVVSGDARVSTLKIADNLSLTSNFSVSGTGTSGDGKIYLSSSNGNLSVTNRTGSTIKVFVSTFNAKM
ncbi:hypothetical protein [Klebsiella sp. C1-16S-Nf17]|nr:hypothetical protein [Klebsiella sp. C1-16S-Nf17]